jgi:hypothetical protein
MSRDRAAPLLFPVLYPTWARPPVERMVMPPTRRRKRTAASADPTMEPIRRSFD